MLLLGVMVFSFLSFQGNFVKSAGVPTRSNGTISPPSRPEDAVVTAQVPTFMESSRYSPDRFSSCSMDTCFDFSRCENMEELLVYHYETKDSPAWQFKDALARSPYYTTDPAKACLYFVAVDSTVGSPTLNSLPYWNNGLNHVVISTAVVDSGNPNPESTGMASTMTTITHQSAYRAGFDLSLPLPQKKFFPEVQKLKALERKYFLTFKGDRVSHEFAPGGGIRNNPILSAMHNGEDIVIATTCHQVCYSTHTSLQNCSTMVDVDELISILPHDANALRISNSRFQPPKCIFAAPN